MWTKLLFLLILHVLVALEGQVPAVKHKFLHECLNNVLIFHQLITEHVGQNAFAVMQVNGQEFTLKVQKIVYKMASYITELFLSAYFLCRFVAGQLQGTFQAAYKEVGTRLSISRQIVLYELCGTAHLVVCVVWY